MSKDKALKLALEALKHGGCPPDCKDGMTDSGGVHPWGEAALIPCPNCQTITAIKEALAQPEQNPVAHSVVAGALFDFMGWLTSRKERIVLSSADNASPAVEAITEFAKMRNLSLDDAKVQDWNTTPPQRTWVGLTEHEIADATKDIRGIHCAIVDEITQAIEAKLKQKNGYAEEKNNE